jgi:DMSO/TMAO reductase YedYZ molybdopterin-dependent catalytic subunit
MNHEEKDERLEQQSREPQEKSEGRPAEEQSPVVDAEAVREERKELVPEEPQPAKRRIIHTRDSFFAERTPDIIEVPSRKLRTWTRRDLLFFGAGAVVTIAGGRFLLPPETLARWGVIPSDQPDKTGFLNHALNLDDAVAEALYSKNRLVPTYDKSDITPLKNNYNGATPDDSYLPGWRLILQGLASGQPVSLDIDDLLTRFPQREQITRLVCVEGWSAVAWWSGVKFDDLLRAYPPTAGAKWARVDSSVNLDANANPDPYYASIDLPTAQHPQTLLATHYNGHPLTVEHGAPLRLLAPMKLGLKNVKAITRITYSAEEPRDYWAERGYSRYDGL